jgi:hypothetical protein
MRGTTTMDKCHHKHKYMRITLALSNHDSLPNGFLITHYCDYCNGRGESFVVKADRTRIQTMIGRSLNNANHKIWSANNFGNTLPEAEKEN